MNNDLKDETVTKKKMGRPRGSGRNLINQTEERNQQEIGEIIPLSRIESRNLMIESDLMESLASLVTQANKGKKQKIDGNDVLANLILKLRNKTIRFNVKKSNKVDANLTLPTFAWSFIESVAAENRTGVSETLEYLITTTGANEPQKEISNENT